MSVYIQNAAKTLRNLKLMCGWGVAPFAYFTVGQRTLQFFASSNDPTSPYPVDLKPGCTFYHDSYQALVTIQGGSGNTYLTDQPFMATSAGIGGWYTSDPTSAKGRNNGGDASAYASLISGLLVPDAVHYIYLSMIDDDGNPDYYIYVDTLQPERGIHPYTHDFAIGSFKTVPRTVDLNKRTGRPIMDIQTRIRNLEGVDRVGRAAGSSVQDDRLAKLVSRLVAFETWANGPGHFGTPPTVGSNTVYTEDQFIQAGDQA